MIGLTAVLGVTSVTTALGATMDCGKTAVCGVITLESGFGPSPYNVVGVHGLWPEVGAYGTSACAPVDNTANPTTVYPCYVVGGSTSEQLTFETHEWTKHGVCSGVKDVDDFFGQICSLSALPLKIMNNLTSLDAMHTAVTASGYEVFSVDTVDDQLLLSACLNLQTRKWVLSPVAKFATACGTDPLPPSPGPAPSPGPPPPSPTPPTPAATSCVKNTHGPPCSADSDCTSFSNCIRCAGSGFCTDVPK